jgi:hypothetical protein
VYVIPPETRVRIIHALCEGNSIRATSRLTVTSIQYTVLGISGGKALAWCKLSSAVFSLSAGNTLTITPNSSGIFTLTGGTT